MTVSIFIYQYLLNILTLCTKLPTTWSYRNDIYRPCYCSFLYHTVSYSPM